MIDIIEPDHCTQWKLQAASCKLPESQDSLAAKLHAAIPRVYFYWMGCQAMNNGSGASCTESYSLVTLFAVAFARPSQACLACVGAVKFR